MTKRCQGFTMIELVMIIVILGILSAYASSRLDFAGHDASGYAEIVKSSIRLAQKLAVAQRQNMTVTNLTGDISVGGASNPIPDGVTVSVDPAPTPTATSITFNALGQPISITEVTTITITGGDVSWVIILEPETGYVHE
jgi:MSHA pilin protein MshC